MPHFTYSKQDVKRHIITDTNGWLLSVVVHAANEHDSQIGFEVMKTLQYRFDRMQKIYADGCI